jgi:hypothetical protein
MRLPVGLVVLSLGDGLRGAAGDREVGVGRGVVPTRTWVAFVINSQFEGKP